MEPTNIAEWGYDAEGPSYRIVAWTRTLQGETEPEVCSVVEHRVTDALGDTAWVESTNGNAALAAFAKDIYLQSLSVHASDALVASGKVSDGLGTVRVG